MPLALLGSRHAIPHRGQSPVTNWQVEADPAAVAVAACRYIAVAARRAIAARGRFRLVLAGGQTPLAAYRRLARSDQDWSAWSLYYGDERCLPDGHPERNSVMVADTGLAARAGQHFPIPVEEGCEQAAETYTAIVGGPDLFDLVVLGIGEDGHTASLFPGHGWPRRPVFAIDDSPKPPAARVTLSIETLQRGRAILVLVSGAGKASAVTNWRNGDALPIAQVTSACETDVIIARESLPAGERQSVASHAGRTP